MISRIKKMSLHERAQNNFVMTENQKQANREDIAICAIADSATENGECEYKLPNGDFLHRFYSYAGDISRNDAKILWGRLLRGEMKKPGSFSLLTLDILRNITPDDVKSILRLAPYYYYEGFPRVIVDKWNLHTRHVLFKDIAKLSRLNLMDGPASITGFKKSMDKTITVPLVGENRMTISHQKAKVLPFIELILVHSEYLEILSLADVLYPNEAMIIQMINELRFLGYEITTSFPCNTTEKNDVCINKYGCLFFKNSIVTQINRSKVTQNHDKISPFQKMINQKLRELGDIEGSFLEIPILSNTEREPYSIFEKMTSGNSVILSHLVDLLSNDITSKMHDNSNSEKRRGDEIPAEKTFESTQAASSDRSSKNILQKLSPQITENCKALTHTYENMAKVLPEYMLNKKVLREAVKSYYLDMHRIKCFHNVDNIKHVSWSKHAAYMAKWISSLCPIQRKNDDGKISETKMINVWYAVIIAFYVLDIRFDFAKSESWGSYINNMAYILCYCNISPDTLDLLFNLIKKCSDLELCNKPIGQIQ